MRTQKYGIEIEMTGITRAEAASVIASYFGVQTFHVGGYYDVFSIHQADNRTWKVMSDGSIITQDGWAEPASSKYSVEVVSPICTYSDIHTIQEIVRQLRKAGARVNASCGLHVHVDASPHNAKTLRNLANIVAAKEDLLYKALNVEVARENYCQKTDTAFLEALNRRRPLSMNELERIWYSGESRRAIHYDSTRYHCLNLHSVFQKGTIEFRLFNSTLHAGQVKSYIQLCLAISHQALVQQRASHVRTQSDNERYTFRTWLLHLGLIGDEFATARHHLLKNLEGSIAWRDPAQAKKQKPRLQERECLSPREETPEAMEDEEQDESGPALSM